MGKLRDDVRRWGFATSMQMRVMRRLEKYLGFRLFIVHTRPLDPNAPEGELPPGCAIRVLEEQEVCEFARNPELGLSRDAIATAFERGDVCYGFLERDALVAYTWSGTKPTPGDDGLWVRFGEGHGYAYKAMTLPSHRGRHLQEHLIRLSERWRAAHGYRTHIDFVHAANTPSLVAGRRYGNRPVGYAGYVKWFGRKYPFRSPGAKAHGFEFFMPRSDEVG